MLTNLANLRVNSMNDKDNEELGRPSEFIEETRRDHKARQEYLKDKFLENNLYSLNDLIQCDDVQRTLKLLVRNKYGSELSAEEVQQKISEGGLFEFKHLNTAMQYKAYKIVQYAIEEDGLDINTRDTNPASRYKETLLEKAMRYTDFELMRALLKHGAKAELEDENGQIALHKAAVKRRYPEDSDLKVFQSLVKKNSSLLYKPDHSGKSPIMILIETGNMACFSWLLDSEFFLDPNHQCHGNTMLHQAIIANQPEMFAELLKRFKPSHIDKWVRQKNDLGKSPLHLALHHGCCYGKRTSDVDDVKRDYVESLLPYNVDVNQADKDGNTALHDAVRMCIMDLSKLLIARGADINAKNKLGLTPFGILEVAIKKQESEKDCPPLYKISFLRILRNYVRGESFKGHNSKYFDTSPQFFSLFKLAAEQLPPADIPKAIQQVPERMHEIAKECRPGQKEQSAESQENASVVSTVASYLGF